MHVTPQISRGGIRSLCALFLLLLFVGPWLLAFAAPDAITEASLPACCQAHGKHKCFMRLMGQDGTAATSGQPALSHLSERCSYNPSFTTTPHSNSLGQPRKDVAAVGFSIASSPVTITALRCSSLSSLANCKRGPPSPALSLETTTDRPAAQQWLPLLWRHDVPTKTDNPSFRPHASSDPAYAA
jgi:hypothetical protein